MDGLMNHGLDDANYSERRIAFTTALTIKTTINKTMTEVLTMAATARNAEFDFGEAASELC